MRALDSLPLAREEEDLLRSSHHSFHNKLWVKYFLQHNHLSYKSLLEFEREWRIKNERSGEKAVSIPA
jgi:hypothetical protein